MFRFANFINSIKFIFCAFMEMYKLKVYLYNIYTEQTSLSLKMNL